MSLGRAAWTEARQTLQKILSANEVCFWYFIRHLIIIGFVSFGVYVSLVSFRRHLVA